MLSDRIMESFGARGWLKRKNAKALKRLRAILEEDAERGPRATVAGGTPAVSVGRRRSTLTRS
jgi:hypothetical protein